MLCEHAQQALSEARYAQAGEDDARPTLNAELQTHLAQCPTCRALQARHDALDRVLGAAAPIAASADFDAAFFSRLALDAARARRRKRLAIAAAVLPVAAAIALAVLRERTSAPEPMILAQLPASEIDLALDLDLVENLDVVEHLDEIEAYELLRDVDDAELERILKETQ